MILATLQSLLTPWTWRMAWRDSRNSRRRLIVFSSSIVLGIGALVAIASFGKNLEAAIELQAKALLGADLVLGSRQAFGDAEKKIFAELGGQQANEISFSSMIRFPATEGSRLIQVRALDGPFPFFGALETDPPSAAQEFRSGGALVEEGVLIQYGAKVGDVVRIGDLTTKVVGSLKKVPGETVVFATIAPRVYLSLGEVERAKLIREGSLARYKTFFQFPAGTDVGALVTLRKPEFDQLRLSSDTVKQRQENLGRSMENLTNFLSLVGFIALLLGGVGVASAIHTHVKQKLTSVAVLRCLGATNAQTFAIYLAQSMALGAIGASGGAALGVVVQVGLPRVLRDFLPLPVDFGIAWGAVLESMVAGFGICVLFALLPLLAVRSISPLVAIRAFVQPSTKRDFAQWGAIALLVLGIGGFLVRHTERLRDAAGFGAGLLVAFLTLAGAAKLLVFVTRKFIGPSLPYVWRQGLANLHRPGNRTLLLLTSLGLGTFLIVTLVLVQQTLLTQLVSSRQDNRANTVLFDIQSDQKDAVAKLLKEQGLPVLDEAPVVTMRLQSIKGIDVEDQLSRKTNGIPNWVLRREFRSTFRDTLSESEKLTAGSWPQKATNDVIPVSLDVGIAKDLRVVMGDEIVWDVQGVPMTTRVAALREVDWRRVQPNFFVVFPPASLEAAPAFHIMTTRADSTEVSANLQRAIAQKFPTISTIDVTLILQTIDSVLGKVAFVIRFMALFTVLTGLLVLTGAILTGRFQRVQESVLLRTLGATRSQVRQILLVEYAALGALAGLTGVLLSVGGAWALSRFVFQVEFVLPVTIVVVAVGTVSFLTMAIGWFGSRGVLDEPPLVILREA